MATKPLTDIILVPEHLLELMDVLLPLKGRAKVYPGAGDILNAAGRAEQRLDDAGVANSNRVGCTYEFRGAAPTANAYKYKKAVMAYSLRRTAKGWVLTSTGSEEVYPKQALLDRVNLTPKAKDAVLRAALAGFGETPVKAA